MSVSVTAHKPYFPALTGLRAVAAYMVFANHFNPFHVARFPLLHHFVDQLHTGVSLFFVLSGFLLFYRYGAQEERIALRPYFQNRFAKIYPVFFLFTTVGWLSSEYVSPHAYVANVTLLKGLFDDLKFSIIPQTWSLTTEEFFYLFLPLIIVVPARYRYALMLPGFLATGFILVFIFHDNSFYGFFDSHKFMLTYTFFGRSVEFFAGIALAHYLPSRNLSRPGSTFTILGIAAVTGVIAIMGWISAANGVDGNRLYVVLVNNFIFPFAALLLLYGLVAERTVMSRMLSSSPMQLLGKSSYVFYLNPLILLPHAVLMFFTLNSLHILATFVLMLLMSIVVYMAIEKPMHRLLSASPPASRKS